jgi:hypothetical protein
MKSMMTRLPETPSSSDVASFWNQIDHVRRDRRRDRVLLDVDDWCFGGNAHRFGYRSDAHYEIRFELLADRQQNVGAFRCVESGERGSDCVGADRQCGKSIEPGRVGRCRGGRARLAPRFDGYAGEHGARRVLDDTFD